MPTIVVFDKKQKMLFKKSGQSPIINLFNSLEKQQDLPVAEIDKYLKNLK